KGLIITDSLGMGALDRKFGTTEAALRSFLAGADVLLFGADPGHEPMEQQRAYRKILAGVQSGKISKERLDDSVRRILTLKMKYGLLEADPVSVKDAPLKTGTREHQKIAETLAEKSITLLKDKHGILPLPQDKPVLVFWPKGPFDAQDAFLRTNPNIEIIRLEQNPDPKAVSKAKEKAKRAKTLLVLTHRADRFPGQAALVKALHGPNLVVAALDVPYDIALFPDVPCYLAAYSNVAASMTALGRVLFGQVRPTGTLPVDIPGFFKQGAPGYGGKK
ncbi:MAG: glycoside hydrolase family 3 N-terminal domain-containing protein, partial [Thermodesulfobacteriota bacterium]|nr:glycoside hydrolase family 3 N-terminal domain-containing protein [Thermodesulfobacteriota bacterium]